MSRRGAAAWRAPRRLPGSAVAGAVLACMLLLFPARAADQRIALVLDIDGAIGPAVAGYVSDGIAAAAARNAGVVVLRLDTPGGLDGAMRDIVRAILASPVPVVSWVAPSGARAASAGTYILYASHLAAMAAGTNLGAATPVPLQGSAPLPDAAPADDQTPEEGRKDAEPPRDAHAAKSVNDAVAYIRGLAELQGRNADWAEQAVRQAASLSAEAARQQNVVELIAADLDELLAKADGRSVNLSGQTVQLATADLRPVAMEPDWRTRLLAAITDPNVAYILMLLGIYGLIFELANPGSGFPGVIGAICLLVGLFALNVLPVDYAGLGLIGLGIALMVAEAFVPAFGVLGIGGAVAFAIGSLILFDRSVPGYRIALPVVIGATVVSAGLLVLALAAAIRSYRRPAGSHREAMLGATAEVMHWGGSQGEVRLHGERWQARGSAGLQPGEQVEVVGRDGLIVEVKPKSAGRQQEET